MASANVWDTYVAFTGGFNEMDSRTFVKLCRDSGLLDKKFSQTDADLLFVKSKGKGLRWVTFEQFQQMLSVIAERRGVTVEAIVSKINACGGPKLNNPTIARPVRFYDDRSTYTGTWKHGGPSVKEQKYSDLSELCNRAPATTRGTNQA
uniref:EF-hand domain-containing protein n=1 Tax=Chromera velia CCMP2878 TaxID=1169474 RepID=A0A0G4HZI8_9ALVE|mmetsp:Transcript_29631/g.58134  ORF Transcript_29631/g.58134 Transcript_29631/m.58134 type:complete len:149 (-) Transcript_29631:492-938(-)|eukprot:Cvel_9724.t1-p1 / transcript=Cvel_9724.t1 / gene=Cvel_9724 / organism=Chromera_velia_CCMP2878 / gene_product=Tubulin polymerization-promoting protein family, putative / transcript_product=Tubulin polymerization-promoting protein family, putative / location=Cvel_scaffold568:31548-32265(-) / protein_length=148 / sequence_SO=supercontig / SO=protein_coding / is_pseudo=false